MGRTCIGGESSSQSVGWRRAGRSLEGSYQSVPYCVRPERAVSPSRTVQVRPAQLDESTDLLVEFIASTSARKQLADVGELHRYTDAAHLDDERDQSGCLHPR